MTLADYLEAIRKRWIVIAVLAMTGALLGLAHGMTTSPTYRAQSQVFVALRDAETTNELNQASQFTHRSVQTYAALVRTPIVLDRVVDELGLHETAGSLAHRIDSTISQNTVLIGIAAYDASPTEAARIANATAAALGDVVRELEAPDGLGESPVRVTTVRDAAVPGSPSSPDVPRGIAVGLAGGLAVGLLVAFVRHLTDRHVRDMRAVRAYTDAPVLGAIPEADRNDAVPLLGTTVNGARAEAFRRVRANLQQVVAERGPRAIVVSSATAGEGTTTTAIDLAIACGAAGTNVVLVDADLRASAVADVLGVPNGKGLSDVLAGHADLDDVVQQTDHVGVDVIASGPTPVNPTELLGSAWADTLVGHLSDAYGLVIIDAPALTDVTDGALLARANGGALVVVAEGGVTKAAVSDAFEGLSASGAHVLGVIANRNRA